jgi:glucose/arabinose dehydrogenase
MRASCKALRAFFLLGLMGGLDALANTPPHTPILIEPSPTLSTDPGDVHMATAPFRDDDPGDTHLCSDWEIRAADLTTVVWSAPCATGVLSVHIHLGDGKFAASGARLLGSSKYVVAVRFRDSSGDPASEWSEWTTQAFTTSQGSSVLPLEIVRVLQSPQPRLHGASGGDVVLTNGASVSLVSAEGNPILTFGGDGVQIATPSSSENHSVVKAVVSSGALPLSMTESNIDFADEGGVRRTIYLPAVDLPAATSAAFWISRDGSSFRAEDDKPHFASLARSADTPWSVLEPGYRVERVVTGLQLPVNLAFVPDPLPDADAPIYYITELYGSIRAVLRDGSLRDYATGLLNFDPTGVFPGSGEQGVVGTAVDPATHDLFVALVYASEFSSDHYCKVVRISSADGGRTASSIHTVLDMRGEPIGPSHQISSLTIGPDGKLYVHMGDGFEIEAARSIGSFRGKILRIDPDGSAPVDNPFYDPEDGFQAADYVFALGFRNPFGGAWRAADNSLYEVENGPDTDRLAKVSAGLDYQWDGNDESMRANAEYTWTPSVAPVNIAFVQQETFAGSGFPSEKQTHAFVSESGPTWVPGQTPDGKRIREFAFDAGGKVLSTKPFVEYAGTGYATVAALAAGPDGLYFSDLYPDQGSPIGHGANVYRVSYTGTVAIGAEVTDEAARRVKFSSLVTVPGATNLTWTFGDGSSTTEANPVHVFPSNGPFEVKLSVTGAANQVVDNDTRVQFPDAPGVGLMATYSDADGAHVVRLDDNIDFDWLDEAPPVPANVFRVVWTGEIVTAVSALYTFDVHTNGSAKLRIDDRLVIGDGVPAATNPIFLEAGHHYKFNLETVDNAPTGVTQLLWTAPGMPPAVVPKEAFYTSSTRRRAVGH